MKAYIKFPTNDVDSFLNKIGASIKRTKRKSFGSKHFNIEVGDVLKINKLEAKVVNVCKRTREVTVIPHGFIKMDERMFRANFFDWSVCLCKDYKKVETKEGIKIVVVETIKTEFFTMERIINVERK